ncbi:MAG: 5-formyltetrahydrofolate cyclo-ligase [Kiritimatiellae bacterium]|nr:5-formyltetrahydrofolate cyclo-ligase [Kiritimatiellia bacterium]
MRAKRKALAPEERANASSAICRKLLDDQTIAEKLSGREGALAVYLASKEEIDLADFIAVMIERGADVVSPRRNGGAYELARLKSLSERDLRYGPMNIREPAEADIVEPGDVSVWIVPGLAFTNDGKRLGYGGGWYDRLLSASRKNSLKLGVAFDFQLVDDLPSEPHDRRLDRIVTDIASPLLPHYPPEA